MKSKKNEIRYILLVEGRKEGKKEVIIRIVDDAVWLKFSSSSFIQMK